jgi:hypothetical protein
VKTATFLSRVRSLGATASCMSASLASKVLSETSLERAAGWPSAGAGAGEALAGGVSSVVVLGGAAAVAGDVGRWHGSRSTAASASMSAGADIELHSLSENAEFVPGANSTGSVNANLSSSETRHLRNGFASINFANRGTVT